MNWEDYIEANPAVLVGKPVVKCTRLAVAFVLELMAKGWSESDLLDNYSTLTREGIRACLAYTGQVVGDAHVYPIA